MPRGGSSRYVFQWHVEGPAGPIDWRDVDGIRTYQYWAPLNDIRASPADESTQTWGQLCDELDLPDEARDLYDPDTPVKSWDQLTKDLALPEEWGFRTQLTIAEVPDNLEISYTDVEPAYHTRDAGLEPGGAHEAHFNRRTHVEDIDIVLRADAATQGRTPSDVIADKELSDIGLRRVCQNVEIPSRVAEFNRRVEAQVGPDGSDVERLIARHELLDNQRLDNDLRDGRISDPAARADYARTHDFSRDRPVKLEYRDSLQREGWRGEIPAHDSDGNPKYDHLIVGPSGETISRRRAWEKVKTIEQAQQAQVDDALKLAAGGNLSDSARQELIDRAQREQAEAIREMLKPDQTEATRESMEARLAQAKENEARLKENWQSPSQGRSQRL